MKDISQTLIQLNEMSKFDSKAFVMQEDADTSNDKLESSLKLIKSSVIDEHKSESDSS